MTVKIKDVADYAGVSTATVSYVINNSRSVSADTRRKVESAIQALNYIPNQTAKSFKTGKTNMIALVVPDISNNFFSDIINALECVISKYGYSLIISNTNEVRTRELLQLKYLSSGVVDGIVLTSCLRDYSKLKGIMPELFPLTLIDRQLLNFKGDSVVSSEHKAILKGMDSLVASGHKKIGFIGNIPHLSTTIERLDSYKAGLSKHSIPFDPSLVRNVTSLSHNAYHFTKQLIEIGCTALVVSNNVMTVDAMAYIQRNHPQKKIAVLGYYHRELSHLIHPEIGVIIQSGAEIGKAAGDLIVRRINDPKSDTRNIVIPSQFAEAYTYRIST